MHFRVVTLIGREADAGAAMGGLIANRRIAASAEAIRRLIEKELRAVNRSVK
jgi:hypothetical protein